MIIDWSGEENFYKFSTEEGLMRGQYIKGHLTLSFQSIENYMK